MKFKLVKIEEGFCRGNVVFHSLVKLSKSEVLKQSESLKSKRELKEKRKKQQDENVKKKQEKKTGTKKDGSEKKDGAKGDANDDDYVTDPGAESDVQEAGADADDTNAPKPENANKDRLFGNFQKKRIIPNIASSKARPAGITKGLWKQELQKQLTGSYEKKGRRGMRKPKDHKGDLNKPKSAEKGVLGKRSLS